MTEQAARANHCAVCDRPIGPSFLMCASHWHMVPRELKTAVFRTWGQLQRCPQRAHFHHAVKAEYFKARDAAIAAVNTRLEGADTATQGDGLAHDE